MTDSSDKENSNLADGLFGKPSWLSRKAFDLISGTQESDSKPFSVQIHKYIDEDSHSFKYALNSRGIVYSEGLHEEKGITQIDKAEFTTLTKSENMQLTNYFNFQNNMAVGIEWAKLNDKVLIFKTELLPNEHKIIGNGAKYYKIEINKLVPIAQTTNGDNMQCSFGGFNFSVFWPHAIVDLIN